MQTPDKCCPEQTQAELDAEAFMEAHWAKQGRQKLIRESEVEKIKQAHAAEIAALKQELDDVKLTQTKFVLEQVLTHMEEGGSYRYLIYDRLGLESDSYAYLLEVGMPLSNLCPVRPIPEPKAIPALVIGAVIAKISDPSNTFGQRVDIIANDNKEEFYVRGARYLGKQPPKLGLRVVYIYETGPGYGETKVWPADEFMKWSKEEV